MAVSTTAGNALTTGRLPKMAPWAILLACWLVVAAVYALFAMSGTLQDFSLVGTLFFGTVLYIAIIYVVSLSVEGRRQAVDRLITALVFGAFLVALLPLVSLISTVLANGLARFDLDFFTMSQRNIVGAGGGALHAIVGTLEITAVATLISVPIGLMTAVYLVEYGRGQIARWITFLVDVMTGIPSIVAGLFAYAVFAIIFGPGVRMGFAGSVALSVLMIPVVVRACEEMLKLVPNELREAAFALGVPKWLTIVKIVLPTSAAGITTGVMLSIARVIGETAPLLLVAGFTQSMNYDLFDGRMQSLPVFVFTSYANQGTDGDAYLARAWTGALTLILIVMALNLIARLIARYFSPKTGR